MNLKKRSNDTKERFSKYSTYLCRLYYVAVDLQKLFFQRIRYFPFIFLFKFEKTKQTKNSENIYFIAYRFNIS